MSRGPPSPAARPRRRRARPLKKYLERRKRVLDLARADGVLDDLLRLERLEEAAAAEREREVAARDRREFLSGRTPKMPMEKVRQSMYMRDRLTDLEAASRKPKRRK